MNFESLLSPLQLQQLASKGYLSLDFERFPQLYIHYLELFKRTQQYFALDKQADAKHDYRAPTGPGASEEGFSVISGEKQIFTCRGYKRTPPVLRDHVKNVWDDTGRLMQNVMKSIATDLRLQDDVFDSFLGNCLQFQEKRTPTLLRLFRYDRPVPDSLASTATERQSTEQQITEKVVAEKHKDLGLLSIVVGSTPGLEVFDETSGEWISIEERKGTSDLCITLLCGQTLRYLTRGQYKAGIHRVKCAARTNADGTSDPFRYSIVFALRPFPSTVRLENFESEKVGTFTEAEKDGIDGFSAQVLFNKLCNAHWNVNISQNIRQKQQKATTASVNPMAQLLHNKDPLTSQSYANNNVAAGTMTNDQDQPKVRGNESRGWKKRWTVLKRRLTSRNAIQTTRVV